MEIGGYENTPAWPKMGPSLLIATCLIVAIRTARWSVNNDATTSQMNLEEEIGYAARIAPTSAWNPYQRIAHVPEC